MSTSSRFIPTGNVWGGQGDGTLNAQRSDLWALDLTNVIAGLNSQGINLPLANDSWYYAQSVTLPELKINSKAIHRDNVPVLVPDYDDPVGPVRVVFLMDAPTPDKETSQIYSLLGWWRNAVRVGRGETPVGFRTTPLFTLGSTPFTGQFMFDVSVVLLKGIDVRSITSTQISMADSDAFVLKNAWLGSIQAGEMSYTNTGLVTLTAMLHPSTILGPGEAQFIS